MDGNVAVTEEVKRDEKVACFIILDLRVSYEASDDVEDKVGG